jgi:hypothetical protein
VKIAVKAGALANARVEDARFAAGAPGEWATPGFEAAPQRIVVQVALGAGDLRLL